MRALTTIPTTVRRDEQRPVKRPGLIRRAYQEIAPEMIDRIAGRVIALLREEHVLPPDQRQATPALLTVSQLAKHLGLNRTWVYEHAQELGAIRLGDGPKARIRFNLHTATQALQRYRADGTSSASRRPERQTPGSRIEYARDAPLIEIRRREMRGVRSRLATLRGTMERI